MKKKGSIKFKVLTIPLIVVFIVIVAITAVAITISQKKFNSADANRWFEFSKTD